MNSPDEDSYVDDLSSPDEVEVFQNSVNEEWSGPIAGFESEESIAGGDMGSGQPHESEDTAEGLGRERL